MGGSLPEKSQVKETHQILRPQTLHSPDHFSSFHGGKCWKTSAFVTEFMTIIPKALDYTGINIVIGTENIQSPNLKSHTVNGRCFLEQKQRQGGNPFISHIFPYHGFE